MPRLRTSGLNWLGLTMLIILFDRLTKYWVETKLVLHVMWPITSFFNITLAHNTGAAFSFLNSASGWQTLFFGSIAILVSIGILIWLAYLSYKEYWNCIALAFVLAGALGNLMDRMIYGFVIDFLDFHWKDAHFAVFNLADSAICIGAFMLCIEALFPKKR